MGGLGEKLGVARREHDAEDEENRDGKCDARHRPENDAARPRVAGQVAGVVAAVVEEAQAHHRHGKHDGTEEFDDACGRTVAEDGEVDLRDEEKEVDEREEARDPCDRLLDLHDELVAPDGPRHREDDHDDEGAEDTGGRGGAVDLCEHGNEVAHQVGERRRGHREHRDFPTHVGHVAEEGRDLVAVVAEREARLHERGQPRAYGTHGEDAHEGAGDEVADHACEHGLPDGETEPEHVDAERDAEDGDVPGEPDGKEPGGRAVAFAVGNGVDAVDLNGGGGGVVAHVGCLFLRKG